MYKKEISTGQVVYGTNQFSDYVINTSDSWNVFDEISADQVLGQMDSADVKSLNKGKIVSVTENDGKKTIRVFNYSELQIKVNFEYYYYYSHDFSEDKFFIEMGNRKYDLSYEHVLYDSADSSSVCVVFSIEDNELFLGEGYSVDVNFIKETYENVFYLDDIMTLSVASEKTFYYSENNTVKSIRIFCERSIDECYIISANGLKEGMRIYE